MGWLEFIAQSEWPAVGLVGILVFRRPIARMIEGLRPKKVKAFGVDAEFETGLERAEALAKSGGADVPLSPSQLASPAADVEFCFPPPPPALAPPALAPMGALSAAEAIDENVWGVSVLSPGAQIIRSFAALERILRLVWQAMYQRTDQPSLIAVAINIGFNADQLATLEQLQALRDKAAHDIHFEPTQNGAYRFEQIARSLNVASSVTYREWLDASARAKEQANSNLPGQRDG